MPTAAMPSAPPPSAPTSPRPTSSTATSPIATGQALAQLKAQFRPTPGYLNAATLGLPPLPVSRALREALTEWEEGRASATAYDVAVQGARSAYASLVGVPERWVAVGSQTSVFAGTLAAALPDGAEVLCVEGDFSSIVFPFLVQARTGRISVRQVPLARLAEEVRQGTTLVAFSLCQSACGTVCDAEAVAAAAEAVGARTFCDVTQAAGWLPLNSLAAPATSPLNSLAAPATSPLGADRFDATVCSAYKWLCQPRGTAYLTIRPDFAEQVLPVNAGWYAGADVWGSCYGPAMELSATASRFDVSPAWLSWVGAVPALELFASVPMEAIREHDLALADGLRARLGMPAGRGPVVSLPDADGAVARALGERGAVVASRAGLVRIAFHVWNGPEDVDLVADALAAAGALRA